MKLKKLKNRNKKLKAYFQRMRLTNYLIQIWLKKSFKIRESRIQSRKRHRRNPIETLRSPIELKKSARIRKIRSKTC